MSSIELIIIKKTAYFTIYLTKKRENVGKIKINNIQKTKIVATIGPASSQKENLLDLVREGVDVFRLNFSHGTHDDHLAVIQNITEIIEKYNIPVGILGDLQGPKLRVGVMAGEVVVDPGDEGS